jgi:hypothetical protein
MIIATIGARGTSTVATIGARGTSAVATSPHNNDVSSDINDLLLLALTIAIHSLTLEDRCYCTGTWHEHDYY